MRHIGGALAAVCVLAGGVEAQAPQRFVLVADRTLTAAEGPSAVSDVTDVTVGADGAAYVVQRQDRSVRVFRVDGTVGRLGRSGRGPGEFQGPEAAGWRGDTLVVTDPYAYRIVGFLRDGRPAFTRTYAIDGFLPRALMADGSTLGYQIPLSKSIAEGRQTSTELLSATNPHGPARVIARLPLRHHTARVIIGSGENRNDAFFPQPFGDADLYDVDPFGRWIVSVSRPVATGRQGTFTLTWRGADGAVLRSVRVPYRPLPLPGRTVRDTIEHYGEVFSRAFAGIPKARLEDLVRDAVFAPRFLPPVTAVVAGLDGTTWVRRAGIGAATWMVFDARGAHVAYVTAPGTVNIMAATLRSAWGSSQDPDGVPRVTRFTVQREVR